ncbi:MAG TPA: hypothetical protein VN923_01915 [Thermoanaerobaculia bacterium]|nr:hypothetical protein [Thermoanaerobaculia bacterium]
MKWLQKLWHLIAEPFRFLAPVRLVVVPLVLLGWGLISAAQGQDAVRAVIEMDKRCPDWGWLVLFCACVTATALQAWYWSRQLLRIDFPGVVEEPAAGEPPPAPAAADASRRHTARDRAARWPRLERLAPRVLGVAVYLVAIAAVARAAYNAYSGDADYSTFVATVTIVALAVLLVAFVVFVWLRRRSLEHAPRRVASHRDLGPITRAVLLTNLVVAVAFVVWTAVSPLTAGILFPSPSLMMLSAALWMGIGSFLVALFDQYRVPLTLTFLPLALVFSCFNDNHTVRTLDRDTGGGDPAARLTLDATFEQWYAKLAAKYPNEPTHPVFVVATEGGGIRAAYWTAAVLTAIQDQAPQFADHLFAISSVSGGSLGGTVFTGLVADPRRASAVDDCDATDDAEIGRTLRFAAQQMLSYDFLAPTLASLLNADFVQRFLPVGFIPDRAKALETGWERGWRRHVRTAAGEADDFFASGFLRMYADRRDALLPSLFLNGTSVEEGNRVIASNVDLRDGAIPNSLDLFDRLGRDMRLSTAAHNSARFTYVSPAGTVRNDKGDTLSHVVDGGYFENSGAQTAADVIDRLAIVGRRGGKSFAVGLILIKFHQVEAEPDACKVELDRPTPPEDFANEAMSPLRALLDTRNARGALAYEEAGQMPPVAGRIYEFLLTQRDHGIVLPLGWLLAPRTRAAIDLQVGPVTPPGVDCAIKKYVDKNVDNLRIIARLVSGKEPPRQLDLLQQEAVESEAAAQ